MQNRRKSTIVCVRTCPKPKGRGVVRRERGCFLLAGHTVPDPHTTSHMYYTYRVTHYCAQQNTEGKRRLGIDNPRGSILIADVLVDLIFPLYFYERSDWSDTTSRQAVSSVSLLFVSSSSMRTSEVLCFVRRERSSKPSNFPAGHYS